MESLLVFVIRPFLTLVSFAVFVIGTTDIFVYEPWGGGIFNMTVENTNCKDIANEGQECM